MSRKMMLVLLSSIVALALPGGADAQLPGVRLGVAGGPSFPLGDLADEASTGFHLRGGLGVEIPLVPLGVRADVVWQQFPDEHAGNFTQLGGLLNATWRMPMPLARPYLIGGAGLMRHEEPDEDHGDHAHEGGSSTEFAFAAGGGLEIRLLRLGAFLEARYLDWGGGHRAVPLTLGITF
jgi:opacity protein-like surface antigen